MKGEVLERVKAISNRLKKEYKAEKVILFGSYVRGDAVEDSDIDLLIIAPRAQKFFKRMATVVRIMRDLRYGLPLSPVVLTSEELKARIERGDQFIQGIVEKGVEE